MVEATPSVSTATNPTASEPTVTRYTGDPSCPPTPAQRDLMQQEILAQAEHIISQMPSMTILHQNAEINYDSRYYKTEDGHHVTCTTYRIAQMDIQLFRDMKEGGPAHSERMVKRLRSWKLETEEGQPEGRDLVVIKTLLPVILSDRFMI